jgi:hypothetical protein
MTPHVMLLTIWHVMLLTTWPIASGMSAPVFRVP